MTRDVAQGGDARGGGDDGERGDARGGDRGGVRVYRVNAARLLVLPAIWLAMVVMLAGSFGRGAGPDEAAIGLRVAGVLTVIFGALFYFGVWRSRLELDAHGITHHQLGYSLHSSWGNVTRLSREPGREGLYLAEPASSSRLLRGSTRLVQRLGRPVGAEAVLGDADALAQGRFIALMPFSNHLRGGSLLRDLQRWAPHLF